MWDTSLCLRRYNYSRVNKKCMGSVLGGGGDNYSITTVVYPSRPVSVL